MNHLVDLLLATCTRWARAARYAGLALGLGLGMAAAQAVTLPPGFQEVVFADQLIQPTAVRFTQDGRVFVAEKRGVVKYFNSLNDANPKQLLDIRTKVYNFWDRGLLGMALHPDFPNTPYLYLLYTYDADIGGAAPKYGTPNVDSDPCPSPPGATADGCVVSGRLSRFKVVTDASGALTVDAQAGNGGEWVMIEDWCQQYPSHSIGTVMFGHDGMLYVSGGDGANFSVVDYGQLGLNPCADPSREGGALRSQDIRTSGDQLGLSGTVVRIDPITGLPADNASRIIAAGLRNPFRMNVRPGTNNEIWIGDVGWDGWEEINVITNTTDGNLRNFGWPCYEGNDPQAGYQSAGLPICQGLYASPGAVTPPYYAYAHAERVVPNELCPFGSSAIAGVTVQFYTGSAYPPKYDGALFFADYSRKCIWAMINGTDGKPNKNSIETFAVAAAGPVDLQVSPGGELFYADLDSGTIRRIQYTSASNRPPTARIQATPTSGMAPLVVSFNGAASTDPDGDSLSYAWDLDGNNVFNDGAGAQSSFVYSQPGNYTAKLRVTDTKGATGDATVGINVGGNTAPTAVITAPTTALRWKVNDKITFSGTANDAQDGPLDPSKMSWSLVLFHCDTQTNCHQHFIQDFVGVSGGSFTAPDHPYPSYLQLTLTVKDSTGLPSSQTLRLDPQTTVLSFQTTPNGLPLTVGGATSTTTFSRTVIVGSRNSISAPTGQKGSQTYTFQSWSDGGTQSHDIFAPAAATTYVARYRK